MLKLVRHSQHNGLYGHDTETGDTFFLDDYVKTGEIYNEQMALSLLAQTADIRGVEYSREIPPKHEK